jgi:hypothetical protein
MGFFRVFLGFSGFFRVLSFLGFFWLLLGFGFFQVLGAPAGEKRNPHPNPVLRRSGSGHRCKNALEPAPVGRITRGLPKT